MSQAATPLNYIQVHQLDRVGVLQLHRPEALNALNPDLMKELVTSLERFDTDEQIGCMVLTGGETVFAAGADIKQMAGASAIEMMAANDLAVWDRIRLLKKPVIAAINGYALGGGCEVAMMCDLIIAGESARFGQPEINIGVIPGAGGTQRLTRVAGKAKAMELILTGRPFKAQEALDMGLINKIVPDSQTIAEAMALAKIIAEKPAMAVQLAKKAILKAFETPLEDGLDYERHLFYLLFASADQKEGMRAFQEKRAAVWKNA
ncbi:enoyl-CoA hydratase-related protein [Vampirovibrio sp.]|uniref:enoyl-CoA hydratase-related protein n=1 Tax=Vampirovibrio sp. TaxID=2717857 RepID=UPI0035945355